MLAAPKRSTLFAAALLVLGASACGEPDSGAAVAGTDAGSASVAAPAETMLADAPASEPQPVAADTADDPLLAAAMEPWTGDLDAIAKRGLLRVGIPYGLATYFIDGPVQRGVTYDLVLAFEQALRARLGEQGAKLTVFVVPTNRSRLLPMLDEGRIDIAAGNITVTPERAARVEFSVPFRTDVRQVLVLGPAAPEVASAEDMLASTVHVLPGSSFREYLATLNARRQQAGKPPFPVVETDPWLSSDDLIEMVAAGILPATVADEPAAEFMARIFPALRVRKDLVLASSQHVAWAMRKNSPALKAAVDAFVSEARKGTRLGNVLLNKYLKDQEWAKNALSPGNRVRLEEIAELLRTYSAQYDFDWLMIGAQGFQESGLDQSKRSHVGAVGVMQLMPTTARDPNVAIPGIEDTENNIHAGVKYLRFLRNRYFDDPAITPLDQTLFSFAAYNAGPGNIAKARKRAAELGLDPNVWLDNVEIATAKTVSREPVVYVRNIYKYYVAYKTVNQNSRRAPENGG